MDRTKRVFTFLTFIICTFILILLTASLATNKWIIAKPIRVNFTLINEINNEYNHHHQLHHHHHHGSTDSGGGGGDRHSDSGETGENSPLLDTGKFRGEVVFGLFQGTKKLNYGFGDRISQIWIKEELMQNPNLMPFGLWLFTILSVAIAILFGIVSSIFAIINTVMTPIEVITGLQGLFLWNGMGALFCTSSCVSWLIQYRNKLRANVLTEEEIGHGWSSKDRAWLGYSFFLVVTALTLFLVNIAIIFIVTKHPWRKRKSRPYPDKNPEGVIMLY